MLPTCARKKPILWLCEKKPSQPRLMPIAIGEFEAAAIQMQSALQAQEAQLGPEGEPQAELLEPEQARDPVENVAAELQGA